LGTTIDKLLVSSQASASDLIDLKEHITIEIKKIMREKIVSNQALEKIEVLSTIKYMIDTIMDYSKEKEENDRKKFNR